MDMFLCGTPLKYVFLMSVKDRANCLPSCLRWAAYLDNSAFKLSSGGVLA